MNYHIIFLNSTFFQIQDFQVHDFFKSFCSILALKQIQRIFNGFGTSATVVTGSGCFIPDASDNEEQVGNGNQNTGFKRKLPTVEVNDGDDEDERSQQHRAGNN